jgi:hypothetical protein
MQKTTISRVRQGNKGGRAGTVLESGILDKLSLLGIGYRKKKGSISVTENSTCSVPNSLNGPIFGKDGQKTDIFFFLAEIRV